MEANNRQIGGTHYAAKLQHWDFVQLLNLSYLPSQVTRYMARWRKKNGVEDLEKALHYMDKFIEEEVVRREKHHELLRMFIKEHGLQERERSVFFMIVNFNLGEGDRLRTARGTIAELITLIKSAPVNIPAEATSVPGDPIFREDRDEWRG